ncbi:hypothetical protein [Cellvibrio sp. KY-GH-1]|uniref:hypothetical protein n=1 Tax=Cellvibrio sp. KY-GH-1 TaxID=2303332 RepID=UPI001CD9AD74|nr:hypothetical protein [Cellvibrio sp. KY-GH-1]
MVLLRKSIPQKTNLQTAAELGVMQKMKIEELANKIIDDSEMPDDYKACAKAIGIGVEDVFNKLSIYMAFSFLNGVFSYDDADFAMNAVWSAMLNYVMEKDIHLVEPCYSIYIAFDEGEYDHCDGNDPIEKYTKPLLKRILEQNA